MAEVIDLAHFARRAEFAANTSFAAAPRDPSSWYKAVDEFGDGGFLSANVLRKLDVDSHLGRFVGLVQEALERLSLCQTLLPTDAIAADDSFLACKPIFGELLMFRDLSDPVGLIALKCFQVAASIKAIVDAPDLPVVLERALTRVRAAPFMRFEEACYMADEIESVARLVPLPGLIESTNELVESAEASSGSAPNE
jgi:hypothetical protein